MLNNNKDIEKQGEVPILQTTQGIKDGEIKASTLPKELRQQCVEVLLAEGYRVPQMAQILSRCEKTIRRDITEIRQRNALVPSLELATKLVGEIVNYSRIHRSHLMRLARSQDSSVSEKAQAEFYAFRVGTELIAKLQTLGYLPLKPQEIIADFSHHISTDEEKSFGELRSQIIEIERVSKESGELTPEMEKELERLKKRIERLEIENKVIEITKKERGGKNE